MSPLSKLVTEIGKTLGRAVLAGLGMELAREVAEAVRKKTGRTKPQTEAERLKSENDALKDELQRLKAERGGAAPVDAIDGPGLPVSAKPSP